MNRENNSQSDLFEEVRNRALIMNAHFHFNAFMRKVEEDKTNNEGTDMVLKEIDKYVLTPSNSQFQRKLKTGETLYRARPIPDADIKNMSGIRVVKDGEKLRTKGYDEDGSRECPKEKAREGRNNKKGCSYIYLANKPEVACSEVKPRIHSMVSVAEFRVKKPLQIIDFSSDRAFRYSDCINDNVSLGELFTLIMQQFFVPISDKKEYKATQIISEHIKKSGIDGIVYRSYYHTEGLNYTFFIPSKSAFEYIESSVFMLESQQQYYCDYNNQRLLQTQSYGETEYNKKDVDDILNKFYKAQTPPPTWDDINQSLE